MCSSNRPMINEHITTLLHRNRCLGLQHADLLAGVSTLSQLSNLSLLRLDGSLLPIHLRVIAFHSQTSRKRGNAVTRSVEIAIHVMTPATFPNYSVSPCPERLTLKVKFTKLLIDVWHLRTNAEFIALFAAILIFSYF